MVHFPFYRKSRIMKPIKVLELSEVDRLKLEKGYHNGPTHSFRIRCKSILLKSEGKSAPKIAEMLEVTVPTVYAWVKRYEENGIKGLETRPGQGRKPIMDCSDEEAVRKAIEEDRQSVSKAREAWQNATGKEASDITFKRFFRNIGARYKRIRKRPRGKPSPQLYAYKKEKLQELEELDSKGELVLYYADESHVCTNGYVPYGWQFKNEDVYIPSEKAARLNIFGMITKRNQYKGFTTKESINADKIVDYLDRFSFNVTKKTVIVLDNASVHRNRKVKELRKIWENRGLFLVYLPPYSPELNPAEILWRILKGKWIRPIDYETTDSLFYCTNRALASVGTNLFVNYSYL